MKIACLEEIALRCGYLSREQYQQMLEEMPDSPYRNYLDMVFHEPE